MGLGLGLGRAKVRARVRVSGQGPGWASGVGHVVAVVTVCCAEADEHIDREQHVEYHIGRFMVRPASLWKDDHERCVCCRVDNAENEERVPPGDR